MSTRTSAPRCLVCGKTTADAALITVSALHKGVADVLQAGYPEQWAPSASICPADLRRARVDYQLRRLEEERGTLTAVERDIARKATEHLVVAQHVDQTFARAATRGQRVADSVARVGGSWSFIFASVGFLMAWVVVNTLVLAHRGFDPYPYILLNLILSCLAALQAPIIMMSQNRLAARDRAQADEDYRVNLKAELEIAALHDKLDHLLHAQWEQLIEMQELQLEFLTELAGERAGPSGASQPE